MAHFNRDNRGGGRKFGKKSFGGHDRLQMHDATCNKCGKQCQVPFRPTGERPVFCSDCFEKGKDFGRKDKGGFHSEVRRMYAATCDTCGKKCEVPFMPNEGRKTYCKECFDNGAASGERKHMDLQMSVSSDNSKNTDAYKEQFEALNAKLDEILNMLMPESKSIHKPSKKKPANKKAVASKKAKKK